MPIDQDQILISCDLIVAILDLQLPIGLAASYRSGAQIARVLSEAWAESNLYCVACESDRLVRERANTQTLDFSCVSCAALYELKSSARAAGTRIPDGAYEAMMRTMRAGRTPNFLALHYEPAQWTVSNLLVIPGFAVTQSSISCRKPTLPKGRGQPWVGCDILLSGIPADARVSVVKDCKAQAANSVREQFAALKPLASLSLEKRGWTLDVLNIVRKLNKPEFTLAELQKHLPSLQRLHPENRHVAEKVRQQLQVLRDLGMLTFVDNKGRYRMR